MKKDKKIKTSAKAKKENVVLVRFLKKTKGGKYGAVENSSLPYVRLGEAIEVYGDEENYYFGLS